jgi:hypothetical protein
MKPLIPNVYQYLDVIKSFQDYIKRIQRVQLFEFLISLKQLNIFNLAWKIKTITFLFILLYFLEGCCKVDTTIKKDPVEMKQVSFNILPVGNSPANGTAKIYYFYYGERKYVLGDETHGEKWHADSILNISVSVADKSIVNFQITNYLKDSLQSPGLIIKSNDKIILEKDNIQESISGDFVID